MDSSVSADKLTTAWPADGIALDLPDWGWRKANIAGAVVCGVWALPCFLLLFHTPESVGCRPDGESAYAALAAEGGEAGSPKGKAPAVAYDFTRKQVRPAACRNDTAAAFCVLSSVCSVDALCGSAGIPGIVAAGDDAMSVLMSCLNRSRRPLSDPGSLCLLWELA